MQENSDRLKYTVEIVEAKSMAFQKVVWMGE